MKRFDFGTSMPKNNKSQVPHEMALWYKRSLLIILLVFVSITIMHISARRVLTKLKKSHAEYEVTKENCEKLSNELRILRKKYGKIKGEDESRAKQMPLCGVIETITNTIPETIRIETLEFKSNNIVTLTGVAQSIGLISHFIDLLKNKNFFKKSIMSSLKKNNRNSAYYEFTLVITI